MQGAIIGAILFEGSANDPDGAAKLAASGQIAFAPAIILGLWPDGRHHQRIDACVVNYQRGPKHRALLQSQRGAWQGSALRRV